MNDDHNYPPPTLRTDTLIHPHKRTRLTAWRTVMTPIFERKMTIQSACTHACGFKGTGNPIHMLMLRCI